MPTTFSVISLGQHALIDPTEGNSTAENASLLVGETFGGPGDPLLNNFQVLSSEGHRGGVRSAYDQNNNSSNDRFSIDGGPDQTFDAAATYNATVVYVDGSTATITAVVFQDTDGNTYLAPEYSNNSDQGNIESGAIQSISLDSLHGASYSGLRASRENWDFVTCFVEGTRILTPAGERKIEDLSAGDLVETRDSGAQAILWVGKTTRRVEPKFAPVCITAGSLGAGLPRRDLLVSPQHRMLVRSRISKRLVGEGEVLVAAKKLLALPGVMVASDVTHVTYYHILCEEHEILFAEGAESESFYLGAMARQALDAEAIEELQALFPELIGGDPEPARSIVAGPVLKELVARHRKNQQALFSA